MGYDAYAVYVRCVYYYYTRDQDAKRITLNHVKYLSWVCVQGRKTTKNQKIIANSFLSPVMYDRVRCICIL